MSDKKYFLTSRHGDCGNTLMFHNLNESGYGSNLDNLELYTVEQAQKYHEQFGRGSLPVLAEKALKLSTRRVDHQYVNSIEGIARPGNITVIGYPGSYDGNDICFMKKGGGSTFNLCEAERKPLEKWGNQGSNVIPWSAAYLHRKSRKTLQRKNVNTRSMCRGVKLKPKPRRSTDQGKTRWNCPSCGKINWQDSPYDFNGCSDYKCDKWESHSTCERG